MSKKIPKIKIDKEEKEKFALEDITVDEFWIDLYNPNLQTNALPVGVN